MSYGKDGTIEAISGSSHGYYSGGHTSYGSKKTSTSTITKVNSIMVSNTASNKYSRRNIGALLNGVPGYMVGEALAEKLWEKA